MYIRLPLESVKHAGEPGVKEQKHVRQSANLDVILTGDTLKDNAVYVYMTAIATELEYALWVRSARSSRRVLTALTWQRGAVAVY